MVFLSTLAAIIASQALITGVFSVTQQAVHLGYLPRLPIVHTSDKTMGQIYVPYVNWILLVLTIWLVITFRSSGRARLGLRDRGLHGHDHHHCSHLHRCKTLMGLARAVSYPRILRLPRDRRDLLVRELT